MRPAPAAGATHPAPSEDLQVIRLLLRHVLADRLGPAPAWHCYDWGPWPLTGRGGVYDCGSAVLQSTSGPVNAASQEECWAFCSKQALQKEARQSCCDPCGFCQP